MCPESELVKENSARDRAVEEEIKVGLTFGVTLVRTLKRGLETGQTKVRHELSVERVTDLEGDWKAHEGSTDRREKYGNKLEKEF